MKAILIPQTGPASVLVEQHIDRPTPGPHELLVEVHATSINPVDHKIRSGKFRAPRPMPAIPGFDASGIVLERGNAVTQFNLGDAIYAMPSVLAQGATAEYCLIDARTAAPKPASLDHVHAAALPLVLLTAWEALFERTQLKPGETALIEAGAGGVGHIAIQLAKSVGATVIATAGRDASIALCKSLGADHVVNYRTQDVHDTVRTLTVGKGVDVACDFVGGEVFARALKCLAYNGRLTTIVGVPNDVDLSMLMVMNQSLLPVFVGGRFMGGGVPTQHADYLRRANQLIEDGKLRVHISERVAFTQEALRAAHERQEAGRVLGKQVVVIRE